MKKFKRMSREDIAFEVLSLAIVSILGFICLYPIIYVFSASISDPQAVLTGQVKFLPKGFSISAYKKVLATPSVWTYYYNTVWYTVVGTALNVVVTILCAYPLSKPYFVLRKPLTLFIIFTMFFSGGLIPTFLLVNNLHLYGTRWVMILISLVNTFNMVLARTFFQTLPEELFESARIEGASEFHIVRNIVIPISMPIIAVLLLYYGVSHWNTYFNALIFLPRAELQPIQVLLRRVVIENSRDLMESADIDTSATVVVNQVKYAVIFFAMFPIMCLYPFLQKYFVKGVMIGALKG